MSVHDVKNTIQLPNVINGTTTSLKTDDKLKIVSWNINGMRTLNMQDTMKQLDASIVLVQETKLTRKQLDQSQMIPPGYSSYFSFSTNKIGYSGVATFCKEVWTPAKAEEGLCSRSCDIRDNVGCYPDVTDEEEGHVKFANQDGRTTITQHFVQLPDGTEKPLTVINVYCPRLRDDPEDATNNTDFKMTFHSLLHRRAQRLVQSGSFVVLAGDINISHRWIDHCDGDPKTFVANDFRKLLDAFLAAGFLDSFRLLHPDTKAAYTCWNTKLNARSNNYGTRIDYIFVDKQLAAYLEKAEIHADVMGSDHCPISATFHSLLPVSQEKSPSPPSFATKYYPEFRGTQKSLKEFLSINSCKTSTATCRESKSSSINNELISSKKRPLSVDSTTKIQPKAKRVQTSLHSFFVKNSNIASVPEIEADFSSSNSESDSISPPNADTQSKNIIPRSSIKPTNPSAVWKQLLKAPQVPLCQGHQAPCVRRTAKKKGMNFGREFWSCSKGVGKSDDPNANCNFFQWVKSTK